MQDVYLDLCLPCSSGSIQLHSSTMNNTGIEKGTGAGEIISLGMRKLWMGVGQGLEWGIKWRGAVKQGRNTKSEK